LVSSRESGAKVTTAAMIPTTSGMFTSRVDPHQNRSRSAPVTSGPMELPAPANPAQMAMARVRSCGGKIAVMIDRVAGMMNAAPTPITARPAISCVEPVATPPTNVPSPKTPRPARSARRRPKRSPTAPALKSSPAKTIAYASTIHCRSEAEAPRSRWIVGSAVLRPDTVMTTRTSDRHMIASKNHRRA
jgi:hypothetical protein